MRQRIGVVISILLLSFAVSGTAVAQDGPVIQHTDPTWQATYWNNPSLSGPPALSRSEPALSHDWGRGAPAPGVSADRFSARWTRFIDVTAGTYRVRATSDDGIRVYVDDRLVIDQWNDHSAQTFTADVALAAGHHRIVVEYYENMVDAVVTLEFAPASQPITEWRGEYFANRWLQGAPVLVRNDARILFDWGYGSPASQVPADGFSVRWTRTINFPAGQYRFRTVTDDGVRLWVDGHLLIDEWYDQAYTAHRGVIYLSGRVPIRMEYYENGGVAATQLSWERIGDQTPPAEVWRGEYYDNLSLAGEPAYVRDDSDINFNWGWASPAPGIGPDKFSVRWTRTLNLQPGSYRFVVVTDDGARAWVNDHPIIDAWRDQPPAQYTSELYLPGGPIPIKVEYYENVGSSVIRLSWQRVGQEPAPPSPDEVIVDDGDRGFVTGGSSSGWRTAPEGFRGQVTWTRNNDRLRSEYNWARWYPNLRSGHYEVFVYVPNRYSTTRNARYWIAHQGGYTLRAIDQSANGGRWVSLGDYMFSGGDNQYVSLADITYEPYLSSIIAFDAIKWVRLN